MLEALDHLLKIASGFGSELPKHYLEVATGVVGLLLVLGKAYAFGRDRLLRKFRLFMLGDEGFWDSAPKINLSKHIAKIRQSIPILMVANFKGGVAKSTIVANLGAFFDSIGLRVLLIDFDYQGSLTDAVVKKDGNLTVGAVDLIEPQGGAVDILGKTEDPVSDFKSTKVFASYYPLNRAENRVVFRWLVGEDRDDVRYRLHNFISSDAVQQKFDVVLIDCPPRLLTATANAVCASTHVIVPTILDDLSVSAAVNTIKSILKLREVLSPTLRVLAVVPTFVQVKTKFNKREQAALDYLRIELAEFSRLQDGAVALLEGERILRKEAIASAAGQSVPYFENEEVRDMFASLGGAIAERVGGSLAVKVENARKKSERAPGADEERVVALRG